MTYAVLACAASLALTTASAAQTPDFSGTWQLDLSRSDAAAHSDTPGPITVSITQSPAEVRIVTTTSRGKTEESYPVAVRDVASTTRRAAARYVAGALVTDAIRDIRGQSVTVQQTRRLSADGNEMIVESVVNVQHGYTAREAKTYGISRDVFVRAPR